MSPEYYPYEVVTLHPAIWDLLPAKASSILDLGGGRGGNGAAIKARCRADRLVIADLSELAVEEVVAGVDATAVCNADQPDALERVWAQHGPFDLVCCLDVLEHLYDPWSTVARLHRLLPVGGRIVASIPNVQNIRCIIESATGHWRYHDTGLLDRTHIRFFSRRTALELMSCTGLVVRGQSATHHNRAKTLNRLTHGLFSDWLALQHLICVEKLAGPVRDPGFCGSALVH